MFVLMSETLQIFASLLKRNFSEFLTSAMCQKMKIYCLKMWQFSNKSKRNRLLILVPKTELRRTGGIFDGNQWHDAIKRDIIRIQIYGKQNYL